MSRVFIRAWRNPIIRAEGGPITKSYKRFIQAEANFRLTNKRYEMSLLEKIDCCILLLEYCIMSSSRSKLFFSIKGAQLFCTI